MNRMAEQLRLKDSKAVVDALKEDGFRYVGNPNGAKGEASMIFGWIYPPDPKGRRYVVAFLCGNTLEPVKEYYAEIKQLLGRKGLLVEQKGV